ncbi:MAG: hypothetical protein AABW86_01665 [Candidatus Micrarchaeota archaeon]
MTELAKKVEDGRLSSILNSIQIALDHYDDIFSDFDPSPFSQRMLSDDFLKEMQKRYIETKKGEFEIRFSLPASIRDVKTEGLVKKRLKDYFHKQIKNVDVEVEKRQNAGIQRAGFGFVVLAIELLMTVYGFTAFPLNFLGVILVPAGWFGMYSGFEMFFDHPKKLNEQKKFYKKFHDAIYLFVSEEEILESIETTSDQKPLDVVIKDITEREKGKP